MKFTLKEYKKGDEDSDSKHLYNNIALGLPDLIKQFL